jgi:NADH dehydrogenase
VAERISDPAQRRAWLRFVIVGAGPTGVELAGAIAELARQTLRNEFRSIHPEEAEIILPGCDASGAHELSGGPCGKSNPFTWQARSSGEVRRDGSTCGQRWFDDRFQRAGRYDPREDSDLGRRITASPLGKILATRTKAATDKGGKIKVQPNLTVEDYPDVYVVGDLASAADEHGKTLPGSAQVAMQGGAYAAKAILRRVKGQPELPQFRYFDKGSLTVIGRACAVANTLGMHLSGFVAWLVWVFIHRRT